MYRRSFLKGAALAALTAAGDAVQTPAGDLRIAYGGIGIECSTYSRLRTRMNEFTILRHAELTSSDRFQFLKRYPVTFMPTLVASAVPGGPVERITYEAINCRVFEPPGSALTSPRPLPSHARRHVCRGHAGCGG